jgi:hypothetical protein
MDPTTGQIGWRLPDVSLYPGAGRWLWVLPTAPQPQGVRVVDTQTGQLHDLAGGFLVTHDALNDVRHAVVRRVDNGFTVFALFDATYPSIRVLGRVPGTYRDCWASVKYVACASDRGSVKIWRVEA